MRVAAGSGAACVPAGGFGVITAQGRQTRAACTAGAAPGLRAWDWTGKRCVAVGDLGTRLCLP